jgi:hypothetical protein
LDLTTSTNIKTCSTNKCTPDQAITNAAFKTG